MQTSIPLAVWNHGRPSPLSVIPPLSHPPSQSSPLSVIPPLSHPLSQPSPLAPTWLGGPPMGALLRRLKSAHGQPTPSLPRLPAIFTDNQTVRNSGIGRFMWLPVWRFVNKHPPISATCWAAQPATPFHTHLHGCSMLTDNTRSVPQWHLLTVLHVTAAPASQRAPASPLTHLAVPPTPSLPP